MSMVIHPLPLLFSTHHRIDHADAPFLAVSSVVFLVIILLHPPLTAAQPWFKCNTTGGNYTLNSTYQANIESLASSLPRYASSNPNLFASGNNGFPPDAIYALALCRGDTTNASSCAACVTALIQSAQRSCALVKTATMYDDLCILRFSNQDFPSDPLDTRERLIMWNAGNVNPAVAARLNAASGMLVNATAEYAVADRFRRFGTGEASFDTTYPKIYALAQCTPDLTEDDCRSCLRSIIELGTSGLIGRPGWRVLGVRCNFRFETSHFFSGRPLVQLPPGTLVVGERRNKTSPILVAVAVPPVVGAVLASITAWYCFRRRRRRRRRQAAKTLQPNPITSDDIRSIDSLLIDLSTLKVATDDFAEDKRLGEGGFGVVYKGDLPEGQEIAVKRLSQTSRQGIEELKAELVLVAKLNHRNLVKLVGVCLEEHEKILVYEYMQKRSLDTILFDAEKRKQLDWEKRFKIIFGITRGMQYLHEDSQLKIVHRDLKASNILLDSDYNPKISDFGLAKIFGDDQSQIVTRRIAGTFGYMSPEYAMRGQYSIKSDVFSLGVLILEIVTGTRNYRYHESEQDADLISVAWEHWTRERAIDLVDPSIGSHCSMDQLLRCIYVGLLCVQQRPADRPLMSAVAAMFSSSVVRLPSLSSPAFCTQEIGASSNSEPNPLKVSSNEMYITELVPR